jgi:thymidylate synthase
MEHIYGTRYEHEYMNLVEKVLATGKSVKSRNGSIVSTFGETLEIDQRAGKFHLLAGRPLPLKSTIGEFAALLREPKHVQDFHDQNCKYWDQWADDDGALRVDYGNAWYNWEGVNQILSVVNTLRNRPHDRRHIVTGWNPSNLGKLSLPCCHMLYQWYVTDEGYLNMLWYQRSADLMVGVPADVILAQLFNMCMAAETGLSPGKIKFMFVDCHIYMNHLPGSISAVAVVYQVCNLVTS